jgi:hypothetical protein
LRDELDALSDLLSHPGYHALMEMLDEVIEVDRKDMEEAAPDRVRYLQGAIARTRVLKTYAEDRVRKLREPNEIRRNR